MRNKFRLLGLLTMLAAFFLWGGELPLHKI